jgi:Protein of unknown function (DUF1257)
MSHFTRVRTKLRDTDALVAALKAVGLKQVEVHDQPQSLHGYQGDTRPERAEVIVKRKHIGTFSNDIGFARRPDGSFEAIISDYDRRKYDQSWLTELARNYSYAATQKYAETHGYEITTDELQKDGSRRLTLRRSV